MIINILAIDTSMDKCSVALFLANKKILDIRFVSKSYKTKHDILLLINDLLISNKIEVNNIDLLACNKGPGNFTSIRNGIAIIQGLAFGLNLPCVGISKLAILAEQAWKITGISNILVAIDAKMEQIYWGEYFRNNKGIWFTKNYDSLITINKIIFSNCKSLLSNDKYIGIGDAWQAYPQLQQKYNNIKIINQFTLNSAENIIPFALQIDKSKYIFLPENIKPVYLRNLKWKKSI